MDAIREILAVGLVLALLAGAMWALRRRGLAQWGIGRSKKAAGRMSVVERLALSPQHALHLVRVADRVLLIAVHASGCTLIESFAWRELEEKTAVPR